MRRYNAEYKARTGRSYKATRDRRVGKVVEVPCAFCGEPVIGGWADTPMHNPCWQAHRSRERRRRTRWTWARNRLTKSAKGRPANPRWPFVNGECAECGEQFTRRGKPSTFCSKKCGAKSRRNWITWRERVALYERDDWTCQICSEPIDPDSDDEWRATLDHIVPRSHGGSDDPENLRMAHLWCNSVRGDLTHYTDTDLQAA